MNPTRERQITKINLKGAQASQGRAIVLASESGSDENTMRAQLNVSPVEYPVSFNEPSSSVTFPVQPFSLTILRLKVK